MTSKVTVARVYLTEGEHKLKELVRRLHDEEKVRGVTVFRGISGFGPSGKIHESGLVDLSLDLPLVLEFFDKPKRVRKVLADLGDMIDPGHVLTWSAELNTGE